MAIDRREPLGTRIVRVLALVVGVVIAVAATKAVTRELSDPLSPLRRWRDPKTAPQVIVHGFLRSDGVSNVPPFCRVSHEHWERCGKNSCWREKGGMTVTGGTFDVDGSTLASLPGNVRVDSSIRFEPIGPTPNVVPLAGARADHWRAEGARIGLTFPDASVFDGNSRILESCLPAGTEVTLQGCVNQVGPMTRIEACRGERAVGVVWGASSQSAIDDAANGLAWLLAAAFFGLVVATLGVVPKKQPLADALALRAGLASPSGAFWIATIAVPCFALFGNLLLHGQHMPSTWSTGRGGYVLGIAALAAWAALARSLRVRRETLRAALRPVLETQRSLLARASGTAELAVRARARDGGVVSVLLGEKVAFAAAQITEIYQQGKNSGRVERGDLRPAEEIEVTDESGEGVLHLGHALLDVETHKQVFEELPITIVESGVTFGRHENHSAYEIEERVIRDGEPLYVLGEVSALALRADESGYRTVRGSPTLGQAPGAEAASAPVIVYAGDEKGLVESLAREARRVELLTVVAFGAGGLLSATLLYVASL